MIGQSFAITGAYGYVGSVVRDALERAGVETVALVRQPRKGDRAVRWELGNSFPFDVSTAPLGLVHCAYDFSARTREDIWSGNVEGTRLLIETAQAAGVRRIMVMSSMSAYPGTEQLYGTAKLEIERVTVEAGGIAVRPGLVYGPTPRGMSGTLMQLARLPVAPVIAGGARQFVVHERDLGLAIGEIVTLPAWHPEVIAVAHPQAVSFREIMKTFAARTPRRTRLAPVPWQALYVLLRVLEALKVPMSLRSDSLLGLVRPAPEVPRSSAYRGVQDSIRPFHTAVSDDEENARA